MERGERESDRLLAMRHGKATPLLWRKPLTILLLVRSPLWRLGSELMRFETISAILGPTLSLSSVIMLLPVFNARLDFVLGFLSGLYWAH